MFHLYPDQAHVNDENVYACHICDNFVATSNCLEDHMRSVHALDGDTIPQIDGNETIGDMAVMTEREIYEDDPALLPNGYTILEDSDPATASISKDVSNVPYIHQTASAMQYNYRLNSVNQTRRLFENTSRQAFDIKCSNYQTINGNNHPTSVSIECNSGVYLSAVKPALERISVGWHVELLSTLITCEDMSERNDMSGRKVRTKVVLFLSENHRPQQKVKVVLHFTTHPTHY